MWAQKNDAASHSFIHQSDLVDPVKTPAKGERGLFFSAAKPDTDMRVWMSFENLILRRYNNESKNVYARHRRKMKQK